MNIRAFYTAVLLFLLLTINVGAQEFIVKNFKVINTDISAREYEVLDVNDEPCALIKIYTGLTYLKLNGNRGVEKIEVKPSEVWVWVPQGTRQLKISKDGMVMLPYVFPSELKSSTVYSLDLTTDQLVTATISTPGIEAEVEFGGKIYKTNQAIPDLAENIYKIKVFKLGYTTIFDTIDITLKNNFFSYKLIRTEQAKMSINSVPSGCVLFVNNTNVGTTNHTGFYFPGEYKINISKVNYLTIDTVITFDPSSKSTFNFNIEKNTCFAKINVSQPGAEVFIDGKLVNNLALLELNAGINHELEVRKDKFRMYKEAFSVKRNDTIHKTIDLEMQKGELSFIIEPDDAQIKIKHAEGADYSWVGSKNMDLLVGSYNLSIARKGFVPFETTFEIKDQDKTFVSKKLDFKKINRVSAGVFSILLPGSGQLYSQRKAAGAGYMVSTFALAGASGFLYLQTDKLGNDYLDAKKAYEDENDITNISDKRTAMDGAYNSYISASRQRDIFITATAGIYLLNIIDAVIFAKKHVPKISDKLGENMDLKLMADPVSKSTGFYLSYKF